MILIDLSDSLTVAFDAAWDVQRALLNGHMERMAGDESTSQFVGETIDGKGLDTIIMLQHEPVYTLGTGSDERYVLSGDNSTIPIVRMDR